MRYAVVIEKAGDNYSAYVPDLPGCIATGETVNAVEQEIATPSASISKGSRRMGFPCPRPAPSRNMWRCKEI